MITYFQAIVIGLLQGVSELFPISSLGHSVILPKLVGWNIRQQDSSFLIFLVATHTATALVLLGFFWNDWKRIIKGMGRSLAQREIRADDPDSKLGWLLLVGTIPAGVLGLLFQDQLRSIFNSPIYAAIFLILNGFMLYGAELLRRKAPIVADSGNGHNAANGEVSDARIAQMSWGKSILIGSAQAIALIPGFSRSGAAMSGGLLAGLSNEDAARFGFLLATPIIGAASLLKLPELFAPANHGLLGPCLVGALCSAISAYLAVRFLMRFFETNRLTPFALYCIAAGVVFTGLIWVKH